MADFFDSQKRNWQVVVRGKALIDVKRELNLVLSELVPLPDPAVGLEVLWIVCREEAAEKKVSQDDFFDSLYGDALQDALDKLQDEIINFTPAATTRDHLRQVVDVMPLMEERNIQYLMEHGREMPQTQMTAMLQQIIRQKENGNTNSSSSSQAGQDKIQKDAHSAS